MWFRPKEHDKDIEMSGMMEPPQKKKKASSAPEETEYLPFDWKRVFFSAKYLPWHILFILIGIATIIITIKHDEVVEALLPFSKKVRDLPAGWLIPIAILIIISFPPLFGHEVIALLCGVVYGLWIGFAVVAAGTFIGEVATWYAFKHTFRNKALKLERTNLNYGAMARLTRDGGFIIVLIIRLSAIPSHFSTAVFSTCDVKFWHFVVATFASLPKQIFLVYLGVLLVQESNDDVIKTVMFGIVFIITIAMGVWIYMKMRKVKVTLLEEQEARRVKKQETAEIDATVPLASERREDDEEQQQQQQQAEWATMQPTQLSSSPGRRYYEEPEWAMQPTQPTRMV